MKNPLLFVLLCCSSLALAAEGPGVTHSLQGKRALVPGLPVLQPTVPHSTLRGANSQGYTLWVKQVTGLPAQYSVLGLHAVDSNTVWAVPGANGITGLMFTRTTNGGITWICDTVHNAPAGYFCSGISALDANRAWIAMANSGISSGGGIFRTTDGGTTWQQDPTAFTPPNGFANFIHFFDADNGVCVGDPTNGYFEIYITSNAGASWSRVPQANIPPPLAGGEAAVWSLFSAAGNSLWFPTGAAGTGRIFRTTDKGLTWSLVVYPKMRADWMPRIEFQDENVGLGNGGFGEFMKTTNGGVTWTMLPMQDGLSLFPLEYVPHTSGMYVANAARACNALVGDYLYGTAYTVDGGANWTMAASSGVESYPDLSFSSPSSGWCGESGPNICKWTMAQGRIIAASVDTLSFVMLEAGQMSETVLIDAVNFGSDPLTVSGIVAPGANFTVTKQPSYPVILPPLGSARFEVSLTPKARGDNTDSIMVLSNATNAPHVGIILKGKALQFTAARAGLMYAIGDSLYRVNTATGTTSAIGSTGAGVLSSLAIRPSDRALFALSTGPTYSLLYRVDPETPGALASVTIPCANLSAIAFSPAGTLFGGSRTGRFFRINLQTGDTTGIGTTANVVYASFSFKPDSGILYASVRPAISNKDAIYRVDTTTGAAKLVGKTGDNAVTPSIAFNALGELYGLKGTGTAQNSLIRISPSTGAGTVIGSTQRSNLQAIIMRTDSAATAGLDLPRGTPGTYALEQNYPNPFNPSTTIRYSLPRTSHVTLMVYNVLGREVATLVNGVEEPGYKSVQWEASGLASGVYFYRLTAGSFVQVRKLMLLK